MMKGKNKNTLPSKDLIQIQCRNQKLYRKAKAKRIQHCQTSFTTNAKGTSLGEKGKDILETRRLQNGKNHWQIQRKGRKSSP